MKAEEPPQLQKNSAKPTIKSVLSGRSILLVNIGSEKKAFIPRLMKEAGLRVVVLHTEVAEWAQPYVDEWILVPEKAPQELILRTLREAFGKMKNPPEGAITFWEEEIPLHAKICEEFGFIGNSVQTAFQTRSKFAMHETFRQKGCNAVKQKMLKSKEDLHEAMRTVGFPAIMKPLFGSDSLYVVYIKNALEAIEQYNYISKNYLEHPYEGMEKVDCDTLVYQEYVDGTEFSVECYIQNGVPNIACVHEKTKMQLPFFVETGDITPPRVSPEVRTAIEDQTKRALVALGVRDSLAHVEIKMNSLGIPLVIEIASRMGGDDIFSSVLASSSFNMVKAGCEIAMGVPVSERLSPTPLAAYAKYFIPQVSGTITAMEGFKELRNQPDVADLFIGKSVGDSIEVPPDGYEVAGWVLVTGETPTAVVQRMENLFQTLCLEVCPDDLLETVGTPAFAPPRLALV